MSDNTQFDVLSGQQIPFSAEAEQSVLGAILIDPQSIDTVNTILQSDYFYLPQHKAIFSVMQDMCTKGDPIDAVTVLESLKKDGVYDDAGGKNYLMQLAQSVPSSANIASYANIVRDKYIARSLLSVARSIEKDVEEGTTDIGTLIDSAEQRIYDIRQGREVTGLKHIREVIHGETIMRIDALSDPEKRDDYIGIPTGISLLDQMITGLNKSDLIILGARPGMGKTSFALNIARNVAVKERKTICFFSLEMSRDQLAQRLLSAEACIKSDKLRTGNIADNEWTRLVQATEVLSRANIYVDESPGITVQEMKAKVRRLGNADLIIVDYLGLMEPTNKRIENRVQAVTEITRNLKLMAKELNIPVLVCSQLRRPSAAEKESNKPSLTSLRDSGSIEQDADIVLFLHRDDYYRNSDPEKQADEHKAVCIVAKNRHGEIGDIPLYWDGQFTRFTSVQKDDI